MRNGRAATLDGSRPFVNAVAIQDGRFLGAGSDEEIMGLRAPKTQVIDVGGKTVFPGLNDSYMHPIRGGHRDLFNAELSLAEARLNELLSLVQLYRALGGGWQE